MKLKKLLCVLALICLAALGFAAAESTDASIDFVIKGGDSGIVLETSLLPDQSISMLKLSQPTASALSSVIRPGVVPRLLSSLKETIFTLAGEQGAPVNGIYSGDFFDQAYSKYDYQLTRTTIDRFCDKAADAFRHAGGNDTESRQLALLLRTGFIRLLDHQDAVLNVSVFDQQWITANLIRDDETVFTASADYSEPDSFRLLLCRRVDSALYYEEITCNPTETGINYVFSLFRSEEPSFRLISEQDGLQYAEIHVVREDERTNRVEGELQSVLLPNAVTFNANHSVGEDGAVQLTGSATMQGLSDEMLQFLSPLVLQWLEP